MLARRITLRREGEHSGKLAAVPKSMADLLSLATSKLHLPTPATAVFNAHGDQFDADDLDLLEHDEVVYVRCMEQPAVAADVQPDTASPQVPPAAPVAAPGQQRNPGSAIQAPVASERQCEGLQPPPAAAPSQAAAKPSEPPPKEKPKEKPPPKLSIDATRDLIKAKPDLAFSRMASGGGGDAGGGTPLLILNVPPTYSDSTSDISDFCADPDKYLRHVTLVQPPLVPELTMGAWEVVPAPVKKGKAKVSGTVALRPKLSALRKVYAYIKIKKGAAPGWTYPEPSALLQITVKWQQFRGLLKPARKAIIDEQEAMAKAAKQAEKKTNDLGGLRKLQMEFEASERKRKQRSEAMQTAWAAREQEISAKLQKASDTKANAVQPVDQQAAHMDIENIEEERRNFFTARAEEKKELQEECMAAKRKYEADREQQRVHNQTVKGEGRKKFKTAIEKTTAIEATAKDLNVTDLNALVKIGLDPVTVEITIITEILGDGVNVAQPAGSSDPDARHPNSEGEESGSANPFEDL